VEDLGHHDHSCDSNTEDDSEDEQKTSSIYFVQMRTQIVRDWTDTFE
jgi:hypothetical protein